MASQFYQNIGPSRAIREKIVDSQISGNEISLTVDRPRTLRVVSTTRRRTELVVQCKDCGNAATIVLHLPYEQGAAAQAYVIAYDQEG